MSRRDDRSSDAKRHRSRFDREPSPKRSRRDGKPETESPATRTEDRVDRDDKHRRRLQDALPLEAPLAHDSKIETGTLGKESETKTSEQQGGTKHSSDAAKVPRSQSFFQHDDRDSVSQNGGSFGRRMDKERGTWRDPIEQHKDRVNNTAVLSDTQRKSERAKDNREDGRAWRHDGYFEMEANAKPPTRKRPAFREQKVPANPEKTSKAAADLVTSNPQDRGVESGRRDDRGHTSRHPNKYERPFSGERNFNRSGPRRDNFSSSDRNGGGNRYQGRDNFTARQSSRPAGGRIEKWKHDLYQDANRSPTPKNEEDQISKIEALLAS